MRRIPILTLLLASAGAISGQSVPGETLHVRGTVIDSQTRQPIPNMRVQLIGGGTTLTSASGTYDIPVAERGSFDLKVDGAAQNYWPNLDHYSAVLTGQDVTVDMEMHHPGEIAGRLIDAETRQPIAGIGVTAGRVSYRLGQATTVFEGRGSVTNPQGAFRLEQLRAGTYSLGFVPPITERVLNSSTPPSSKPETGYRRQRFPNTGNSAGVQLHPSGVLDVGDILLPREPFFKITGVLRGCANGDDLSRGLSLIHRIGGNLQVRGVAAVACGERFTMENLAPGEYLLELNVERVGQVRVGIVTILDRDVELNPIFSMPLTIVGNVAAPENFPAAAELRVGLNPGRAPPVQVRPDGKFELTQETSEPVEVTVSTLPPPYYVSEMSLNGAPLRDGILELNPYSVARELKIRIAADGAWLSGSVRKNAELAPNSSVILVAWPERLKSGFPLHYVAKAPYGQFTFSGVPPGSYRAIAVAREAWEGELQRPGVLSGLISSGTQVDLAPNASRELALEVRWIPLSQ